VLGAGLDVLGGDGDLLRVSGEIPRALNKGIHVRSNGVLEDDLGVMTATETMLLGNAILHVSEGNATVALTPGILGLSSRLGGKNRAGVGKSEAVDGASKDSLKDTLGDGLEISSIGRRLGRMGKIVKVSVDLIHESTSGFRGGTRLLVDRLSEALNSDFSEFRRHFVYFKQNKIIFY